MGRLNLFKTERFKLVPCGTVVLQDDGTARIQADPSTTRFLETQVVGAGRRRLTPKDGQDFLAGVLATCRGQGLLAVADGV